jgi:hypothetical protein
MLKTIILNKEEAMKLPVEIRSKNGVVKKCVDDFAFSKTFTVFKDIKGKTYLLAHGNREGLIQYNMTSGSTDTSAASMIYEMLVDKDIIKDGTTLNVICCYGNKVKATQQKLDAMGLIHRYNDKLEFVNETYNPCNATMQLMQNGKVRLGVCDMPMKNNKLTLKGWVNVLKRELINMI